MNIKKIMKNALIRISESSKGPKVQEYLRGMCEIVDANAGRSFRAQMIEKLSVTSLTDELSEPIRDTKKAVIDSSKIKIRFFHCNSSTFNVIETICDSFRDDTRYDVLIVLFGTSYSSLIDQMIEKKFHYVPEYNYDIDEDQPDISVIYHLEIVYPPQLLRIREKSKFVALVPLSIGAIWFGERTISRMHLSDFRADICFIGELCYGRLENAVGKSVIEKMSPPQFDLSYKKLNKKPLLDGRWEKLNGKKTVVYMTDHGLKMNIVSDEVSFDLYIGTLIEYAKKNPDFGLIIRPHFALVQELLSTYWRLSDYKKMVEYCEQSPNIVWDESDDYLTSLSIADASLVDVNCSLVYYALAALNPIGVPLRYDMNVDINNPDLINSYYKIQSADEMIAFFDQLLKGDDPMRDIRLEAYERYIGKCDGGNGLRIKDAIEKKYFEKFKKRVD